MKQTCIERFRHISGAGIGIPDQPCRVMFLDEGLQSGQGGQPGLGPLDVHLALLLPVLEHTIGVELAGLDHVLHKWGWGRTLKWK